MRSRLQQRPGTRLSDMDRNIMRAGGVSTVSTINKNRKGRNRIMRVRPPHRRAREDWRIGAMTGTTGAAVALGLVLVGAYLVFHKG